MNRKHSLLAAFGLLTWQASALAAQVVRGEVREDSTGRPLAGVEVLIEGSKRQTVTDKAGAYFLVDAPTGSRVVLFRSVGYRPLRLRFEIGKQDTVRIDATLVPEGAQRLEPLDVSGQPKSPRGVGREAFDERRRLGFGKFIDSTELRRFEGRRLSDVLRGRSGIRLVNWRDVDAMQPRPEVRAASTLGADFDGRPCWMSVFIDGVAVYREGTAGQPPDLSRDFPVASLDGVEIYRNASEVPLEFGGSSAGCGVLVLWTRRD
jgi:TonB-dependent starch-binding outer membrane protein SusC